MKTKRFKGDTVIYFIFAVLCVALGVVLIPSITDLGQQILNVLIAVAILSYLFGYLAKKLKRTRQTIFILTAIEFGLLLLIALGLILSQFKVINIAGGCKILGLALALRGVVEMFRAYYHQSANNARYPLWQFVTNLVILVFGVYIFAKPFITDQQLILVAAVASFVCALIFVILGFSALSQDKKKK
ncbi:MAG: hypothetical protein IKA42_01650 [Clostridia bacterium]|nr:hypothetical protein [Clostridia bacterium]MBR2302487.1 hypothetical protein [Clostridia bacterium]